MAAKGIKSILVAVFSLYLVLFSTNGIAQDHNDRHEKNEPVLHEEKLDPARIIMDHIKDAHEFHFFTVGNFHATIPLPVILYSPGKGLSVFSSSKFEHGHASYEGYSLHNGNIVSSDGSKVYDFSLTKNVVQMFIALAVLVLLMTGIAKK